jgi:hypothetical protein
MSTKDEKGAATIELRNAQIIEVGGGFIELELSGRPEEPFRIRAGRDAEKWAAARLYTYVDIAITLGPAR